MSIILLKELKELLKENLNDYFDIFLKSGTIDDARLGLSFLRHLAMLDILVRLDKKDRTYGLKPFFQDIMAASDIEKIDFLMAKKYNSLQKSIKTLVDNRNENLVDLYDEKDNKAIRDNINFVLEYLLSRKYLKLA